ncbi:glycosyltransferase family A protein [Seonamhaeicola sp. ML3]|uniref:glycosyltransferase family 2 protein n=1 Tax=Seonamhaeicola sp. ML3 TaxID=2937786 RepID=UPI00200CA6E3|nr:glycosyltransferase family A protein [Seonamhaeicola sp. ML3]
MNNDLVSIIVPCYNQGKFLDHSLCSVYNQTYTNWECIIVNDGSFDDSEAIAKEWVEKDKRFQYYFKENSGVSATRNFGLDIAKGQFIQFLDADDYLKERKLESSLEVLNYSNNANEGLVITNFNMVSVDFKKEFEPYCKLQNVKFDFENLLYKWNDTFSIPIHCGFFKSTLFQTVRFPENLTAQEDWIVWVKIFNEGAKAVFLNEPLVLYRKNPKSRTKTKSLHHDQILAYDCFKTFLNEDEYQKLSKVLISRYYREQEKYKNKLSEVKESNPYQAGLMIRKVLKQIRLLGVFRKLFPFFLKFKKK